MFGIITLQICTCFITFKTETNKQKKEIKIIKQGASERNKYKIIQKFFWKERPKKGKISICFKKFLFLQHFLCPFLFISFLLYKKNKESEKIIKSHHLLVSYTTTQTLIGNEKGIKKCALGWIGNIFLC